MNSSLKLALGLAGVLAAGFGSSVMAAAEKAETKTESKAPALVCGDLTASACEKMNGCSVENNVCGAPMEKRWTRR